MAVLAFAAVAEAKPPDVDSEKLRRAVTVEGIVDHQRALQTIANLNGGTRHTETPGYAASVAYVWDTMEKAGLDSRSPASTCPSGRRPRRRCSSS
jgi:hypothetical protein